MDKGRAGATGKGMEYTGSPDQKPAALYGKFVLASSNPGELVLDPFCGSATTLMAAHNLGRRWAGIEQREEAIVQIDSRLLRLGIDVRERRTPRQALVSEHQIRREAPVRTDIDQERARDMPNTGPGTPL